MGKVVKKTYKPTRWDIVEGVPDETIDAIGINKHDISLIKADAYDDKGVPFKLLTNINILSVDGKKNIRLTEILSYKPCDWVMEIKDHYSPNEIEPFYEHFIEVVDIKSGFSTFYKLENGLEVSNAKLTDEICKLAKEPEQPKIDPFDLPF